MTILVPLLTAIAGLLIYALGSGKVSEAGRLLFFAGALVTLLALQGHSLRLL